MSGSQSPIDAMRVNLVDELARRARHYRRYSLIWSSLFNVLQIVAIVSGPAVAILTAYGGTILQLDTKIWIVVVSNAGSAATALVGRLRVGDLARARQIGLAGVRNVLLKGNETIKEVFKDEATYISEIKALRQRLAAIEFEQVNLVWPARQEAEEKK